MQTTAEVSPQAIQEIHDFIVKATKNPNLTQADMRNAMTLVVIECDKTRSGFALSEWHRKQPVHSFEALSCKWQGVNHRWSPLTLNLHFMVRADGTVIIGTEEELPVQADYFILRVIEDAKYSPTGG